MKQLTEEEILNLFRDKMAEVAKEVLGKIIGDYIPYAASDKIENVEWRARDWIANFFDGLTDDYIKIPMLSEHDCENARELVYQKHKEEIAKLIGQDKDQEIARLQSRLERAYSRS